MNHAKILSNNLQEFKAIQSSGYTHDELAAFPRSPQPAGQASCVDAIKTLSQILTKSSRNLKLLLSFVSAAGMKMYTVHLISGGKHLSLELICFGEEERPAKISRQHATECRSSE
jgi:hypothetical protein